MQFDTVLFVEMEFGVKYWVSSVFLSPTVELKQGTEI